MISPILDSSFSVTLKLVSPEATELCLPDLSSSIDAWKEATELCLPDLSSSIDAWNFDLNSNSNSYNHKEEDEEDTEDSSSQEAQSSSCDDDGDCDCAYNVGTLTLSFPVSVSALRDMQKMLNAVREDGSLIEATITYKCSDGTEAFNHVFTGFPQLASSLGGSINSGEIVSSTYFTLTCISSKLFGEPEAY